MKFIEVHVNRREWLGGMLAWAMPTALSAGQEKEEEYTLRNASLDFSFVVNQGKVTSRRLRNKLANEVVDLPEADFALELEEDRVVNPSDFRAKAVRKGTENIELLYSGVTGA